MRRFVSLSLVAFALVLGPACHDPKAPDEPTSTSAFALDADDDGCPGAWGCKAAPEPTELAAAYAAAEVSPVVRVDVNQARANLTAARDYLNLALLEIPGHLGPEYQDPNACAEQATDAKAFLLVGLSYLPTQ